jgi:hypothetical protein
MLKNRLYLGELHFGKHSNLEAHPAIVDPVIWQQAQRTTAPVGRQPKSDFLLARLKVLRCGTCGSTLGPATHHQHETTVRLYRCTASSDPGCTRRVSIRADVVEPAVIEATKQALKGIKGEASAEARAREADEQLDRAQADLDAALRAFSGLEDEPVAQERLQELRATRDAAREHAAHLRGTSTTITISATTHWDDLTLTEHRDLVRTMIARVVVGPGVRGHRSVDRLAIELRPQ